MNNFKGFYEEHREKLVSYLMRVTGDCYLSNDISQESFTRYLEHYGNHTKNVSLLYTIARNTLLDHFRRAKKDYLMFLKETGYKIIGIKEPIITNSKESFWKDETKQAPCIIIRARK